MRESRLTLWLPDEGATRAIGTALAACLPPDGGEWLCTLAGDLGAGKTTLARALLRSLGVAGPVRSPTYTLAEPYEAGGHRLLHLDLYRLAGGDELEAVGYRDLRQGTLLTLVEWPEKACDALGTVDLAAELDYEGSGRRLTLTAGSTAGETWLAALKRSLPVAARKDSVK